MNDARTLQHLKYLSTFHYILAALIFVMSFCPCLHLFLGITMLLSPESLNTGGEAPPQAIRVMMGATFTLIPVILILLGWVLAYANAYAASSLAARQRHTFCVVVAGVNCMKFPFGTALGVFSLIVLLRPGVPELFDSANDEPDHIPA